MEVSDVPDTKVLHSRFNKMALLLLFEQSPNPILAGFIDNASRLQYCAAMKRIFHNERM